MFAFDIEPAMIEATQAKAMAAGVRNIRHAEQPLVLRSGFRYEPHGWKARTHGAGPPR